MPQVSEYPSFGILLVDDEMPYLRSMRLLLERKGGINNIHCCDDSRLVIGIVKQYDIGVILLDLTMPHVSGMELLDKIHTEYPNVAVIIISGLNNVSSAVACLKKGAFDYYVKTTEEDRLLEGIRRTVMMQEIKLENKSLKAKILDDKLQFPEIFEPIVSRSQSMNAIFHYIESISVSSQPILISGESGTGKELIAQACHKASGQQGALISLNVAGLDDEVFSDTLFGHFQGAFTGAAKKRKGLVEQAAGGTLFLDEIGDLSLFSQVKLLRLLQEGEYYPLGSDSPKRSHARIVVASHQNIEQLRDEGGFRKDLYYRLQTHVIQVPPLRSRKTDIPYLLDYFISLAAEEMGKPVPNYPPELPVLLCNYDFPGNVRELRSMIYDAVSRHKSRLLSMDVFKTVLEKTSSMIDVMLSPESVIFNPDVSLPSLSNMNDLLVKEAMERAANNQSLAARMLGISQPALSKRLKKLH